MRRSIVLLIGLGLIGCQRPSDAPALPPVPLAASGPATPDGVYRGRLQTVRGGELCGTGDTVTFTVRGRSLHYELHQPQLPEQRTRTFDAPIRTDGHFAAVDGPTFIKGTLQGGHMQGEISGDACGFAFQADRSGTW